MTVKLDRREQILTVLANELEKNLGSPITTSSLANAVGFSEAALYRHFASKSKMFESLIDFAENLDGIVKDKKKNEAWRKKPIKEVISYSLINGIDKYIVEDIENIRENYDSALE